MVISNALTEPNDLFDTRGQMMATNSTFLTAGPRVPVYCFPLHECESKFYTQKKIVKIMKRTTWQRLIFEIISESSLVRCVWGMFVSWLNCLVYTTCRSFWHIHFQVIIIHMWHHQRARAPLLRFSSRLSFAATKDKRSPQRSSLRGEECRRKSDATAK